MNTTYTHFYTRILVRELASFFLFFFQAAVVVLQQCQIKKNDYIRTRIVFCCDDEQARFLRKYAVRVWHVLKVKLRVSAFCYVLVLLIVPGLVRTLLLIIIGL